jgi:glycine/D-amino acid oxidase-like deaminating enzyme
MYNLVVIGAGITGVWSAFMKKDDVLLVEKEESIGKNSLSSLWSIMPPLCGEFQDLCLASEKDYDDVCFNLGVFCKKTHILKLDDFTGKGKLIGKNEVRTFEPQLDVDKAEMFENGMFVEGSEFFTRMEDVLNVETGTEVLKINYDGNSIKSLETNKGEITAKYFIFSTGFLTKKMFHEDISLFKGHLIRTKKVGLNGILISKNRIAVEGRDLYLNGDSVNTEDPSVVYDELRETVSIISKFLRIDTSTLSVLTGFRTVTTNGKPLIKKVSSNAVLLTGYKFGFALAPYLAREGIKLLGA